MKKINLFWAVSLGFITSAWSFEPATGIWRADNTIMSNYFIEVQNDYLFVGHNGYREAGSKSPTWFNISGLLNGGRALTANAYTVDGGFPAISFGEVSIRFSSRSEASIVWANGEPGTGSTGAITIRPYWMATNSNKEDGKRVAWRGQWLASHYQNASESSAYTLDVLDFKNTTYDSLYNNLGANASSTLLGAVNGDINLGATIRFRNDIAIVAMNINASQTAWFIIRGGKSAGTGVSTIVNRGVVPQSYQGFGGFIQLQSVSAGSGANLVPRKLTLTGTEKSTITVYEEQLDEHLDIINQLDIESILN